MKKRLNLLVCIKKRIILENDQFILKYKVNKKEKEAICVVNKRGMLQVYHPCTMQFNYLSQWASCYDIGGTRNKKYLKRIWLKRTGESANQIVRQLNKKKINSKQK